MLSKKNCPQNGHIETLGVNCIGHVIRDIWIGNEKKSISKYPADSSLGSAAWNIFLPFHVFIKNAIRTF